jgi:hypothetical protein
MNGDGIVFNGSIDHPQHHRRVILIKADQFPRDVGEARHRSRFSGEGWYTVEQNDVNRWRLICCHIG